jgi:hypothetical protein
VCARGSLELLFERGKIVVPEGAPRRTREPGTSQDAGMTELVIEHEVLGPHERRDEADVGPVPTDEDDSVLRRIDARQAALEITQYGALPGNEPARRNGRAVLVDRNLGRCRDGGRVIEPEIVVRCEVHDLASVDHGRRAGTCALHAEERVGHIVADPDLSMPTDLPILLERIESRRRTQDPAAIALQRAPRGCKCTHPRDQIALVV